MEIYTGFLNTDIISPIILSGRDSVIDKANNTKTSSASPPNSQQGSITVQSLSERLAPSDPMPHDTDPLTSQTVDCQCSNTQGTKNMSSQDLTSSASEAIDLCGPALPPGFSIGETQPHQVHPPGGGSSNRDRAGEEDRELWVVGADGQSHKTGNIDSSKVEKKKHKKHSVKKKKVGYCSVHILLHVGHWDFSDLKDSSD